jgi:hypothetical protein
MVRSTQPARYLEVGSGLSTYYCQLAGERNVREGSPLEITCIEPNHYQGLKQLPGIRVIQSEVQDVSADIFRFLFSSLWPRRTSRPESPH